MNKKTIRDIDVSGKRVLVRVDFNIPMKDGAIRDVTRITKALPTLNYLIEHKAKIILLTHLGRPKGKFRPEYSVRPVAEYLGKVIKQEILCAADCGGKESRDLVDRMRPGQVILLENTRFCPGEEENSPELSRCFAGLGEIYVNDAFGAAHRAHSSTEGIAHFLPAVAGFLMEKEILALSGLLERAEPPFLAILGGAKVSDKITVIRSLFKRVDMLVIGGGMANTMLKAVGYDMGKSRIEKEALAEAKKIIDDAQKAGIPLLLPKDVVAAREFKAEAEPLICAVDKIPADHMALDIGPKTIAGYTQMIEKARTIFWNGPLGVYEFAAFAEGTNRIAQAAAVSKAKTVIGGGDVVAAVERAGLADEFYHISTGGGASLEFLEGRKLPGLEALLEREES